MKDIELINDTHLKFHKLLWNDAEIVLARCFNFDISDDGDITASISLTNKESLYSFIKLSFKSFSESPNETVRRNAFYSKLEDIYKQIDNYVFEQCNNKLPYYPKFYKHQREGMRFSYFNRVCFLAFQMRLGKSIVAASMSRMFNIRRTIILCPAVAKMGWFKDMTNQWGFNELFFTVLDAAKSRTFIAFQERFVIANYDSLEKYMPHLLKENVGHIILDEAHRCKGRFTARFKNVEKLLKHFPNAKVTMLSGSPVPNRFNDLFAYFKLAGHELGKSYKVFCDEFTIKSNGRAGEKITGAKNISDLKLKMSNFMIVKEMAECWDMPADIISRYTFQMDDYRPEYDKIIQEMIKEKEMAALNGHIHSLNIITCKSKIKGIIEALEEILEETGKVVVFGTYKEPLKMLEYYFGERCVKVVGGVSSYDRDRYKEMFHKDPKIEVFLANFDAGGEALDLSISNDVFFINFPMSPRELNQAKFRCKHPEKRDKHLRVHFTFCEGSVDEHIYENIILDKEIDANMLLHGGKDVVFKENMTEKLIKAILHKNDITFTYGHKKAEAVKEEEPADLAGQQELAAIEKENIFARKNRELEELQSFTPPSFD